MFVVHRVYPFLKPAKVVKFIYSEKATKFCKISTVDLTGTTKDKSKVGTI